MSSWEIDSAAIEAYLRDCGVVPVVSGAVEGGLKARHLQFEDTVIAGPSSVSVEVMAGRFCDVLWPRFD